jgi:hypothetical protein
MIRESSISGRVEAQAADAGIGRTAVMETAIATRPACFSPSGIDAARAEKNALLGSAN